MRVLHVIPGLAARYGGPSRAIVGTCLALRYQGVESLILTTDADGPGRLPVELARPVNYEGVQVIFFPRQHSEAFKYSRPLAHWLEKNVASFDLVDIEAVFSHSSLAAARACRRAAVAYVVRPLGSLAPWCLSQKRLRKRLLWHAGVKRMLHGAAAIHYTTAKERDQAETTVGLGCGVVIPLGIDEDILNGQKSQGIFRRRHSALGDDPYVLILCRLHPIKGLELFLRAFLGVTRREEFRHWRLVVAGEGEPKYVASLKRLAEKQDGDGRVLFTGWVDGAEKVSALQEAALLALPSHHENFGLSLVEALARGVPVLVSTGVNLSQEIAATGAGWVARLEGGDLSKALAEALREERERASRGSAGRELVRSRYTWPVVAAQLADFYRSVARHSEREG